MICRIVFLIYFTFLFQSAHSTDLTQPVVTAKKYIEYKKKNGHISNFKAPKVVLICYQQTTLKYLLSKNKSLKPTKDFSALFLTKDRKIGVLGGWGIGAPALANKMEQLIVLGTTHFIAIGTAGSLQGKNKISDYIIAPKALAEDGVAHLYLDKGESSSDSDPILTEKWVDFAKSIGMSEFNKVNTWSFSAIFRETPQDILRVTTAGYHVVEMESATMYAVSKSKNVSSLSLFVISDVLTIDSWEPHIKEPKVRDRLHTLAMKGLDFCIKINKELEMNKNIMPNIKTYEEFEKIKNNKLIWENAAKHILNIHKIPFKNIDRFVDGSNIVFSIGNNKVLKIYIPELSEQYLSEKVTLEFLKGKIKIPIPEIIFSGDIDQWPYIIMSKLDGTVLEREWEQMPHSNKIIIIQELGKLIKDVHSIDSKNLNLSYASDWNDFIETQIVKLRSHHEKLMMPQNLLSKIDFYVAENKYLLKNNRQNRLLTGEYTPMNILIKSINGIWHISGLIDFGDTMIGDPDYDLLGPGAFLIQGDKILMNEFLLSYGYSQNDINDKLAKKLTTLSLLHRYSNLNFQIRIKDWQQKITTFEELENLLWGNK